MLTPASLQAYMRAAAALTHEVVELPPFAVFLNPNDPLRYYNYAIPLAPVRDLAPAALAALRAAFAARERLLRFEFIREYAPGLGPALRAAGLAEEGCNPLLVCTAETFRPAAAVPDLAIRPLAPDAPRGDLAAFIRVQARSFGEDERIEPTAAQVDDLHRRAGLGGGSFLGLLDGEPVAAAAHTAPLGGFIELVGIATLPGCRRRGIAGALVAAITRAAFAAGVQVAFLSAADERAGRVYERVGFKPYATAMAYCEA